MPTLTDRLPAPCRPRSRIAAVWALSFAVILAATAGAQEATDAPPEWQPAPDTWLGFASATCEECEWLKTDFLPDLEARFRQRLPPVAFIDTDDIERNYPLLGQVEEALGSPGGDRPVFLVGSKLLYGKAAVAAWGDTLRDSLPRPELPEKVRGIVAAARNVVCASRHRGHRPDPPP